MWAIKLQKCVSTSTAAAQPSAVVEASTGAVHLANLLKKMNTDVEQPLPVFVDNQACIALSKNSMDHGKIKHFALKVHFSRNFFETKLKKAELVSYRQTS